MVDSRRAALVWKTIRRVTPFAVQGQSRRGANSKVQPAVAIRRRCGGFPPGRDLQGPVTNDSRNALDGSNLNGLQPVKLKHGPPRALCDRVSLPRISVNWLIGLQWGVTVASRSQLGLPA